MSNKKKRPGVLREPTSAESKKSDGPFFVSSNIRCVNLSGLYFHLRSLAGLILAGGIGAERLALWLPALDMTAKVLRQVVEGRV